MSGGALRRRPVLGWLPPRRQEHRWLALLIATRLLGAAAGVLLLLVHRVTPYDGWLAAVTVLYAAVSLVAFSRLLELQRLPAAWLVDTGARSASCSRRRTGAAPSTCSR